MGMFTMGMISEKESNSLLHNWLIEAPHSLQYIEVNHLGRLFDTVKSREL